LDRELRTQFKLGIDQDRLVITNVERGSSADLAGLEPGDVILAAGKALGKDAENAEHLSEMLFKAIPEKGLLLRVKRGDNARFVVIKPDR